jgi:PTH2 family peptidyl-tRNA hydrolase
MNEQTKQVLIWRADLRNTQGQKVRTGKLAAQLAHASMKAILDLGDVYNSKTGCDWCIPLDQDALYEWITGIFTKVAVVVNSEQELRDIYNRAVQLGIPCALIEDCGLTEFDGQKTITCAAVGPAYVSVVDTLTGHLKLL